jgi:hypothetical protein
MQDISPVDVFDIDVSPQSDQRVDGPPAASEGGEEERRALLLIHGVDIGALGDQKLHDLGMVEHGGAMQRRHLHKKVLKLKSSHLKSSGPSGRRTRPSRAASPRAAS